MTLQTQVSVFDRRAPGSGGSRRPHHLTLRKSESPSPAAPEPPWAAALDAHEMAGPCASLSAVWQDVLDGRLTVLGNKLGPSRHLVLARTTASPRPLNRVETAVLVRVLCGEQQKVVAAELGIACSTASKWFTLAVRTLNLARGPLPCPW